MIEIQDLTVKYQSQKDIYTALESINLAIPDGGTCAVIGPSGCGKSTLLKVLAGIITTYEGEVRVDGATINPQKQAIGFIPQNYGLLPWRTVDENINLGMKIKQRQKRNDYEKLQLIKQQLGIAELGKRYPGEISGGQQQRVSLARAFLLKPDLLLMDEPFSALDAITREEMQDVFLSIWDKYSVSTVLVTHYVEEAIYLGQKIVILSPNPGKISRIIENPLFGGQKIRQRPEFFELGLSIRNLIKKDWSK